MKLCSVSILVLALGVVPAPRLAAQIVRGPELVLNSTKPGPQWMPDVAMGAQGGFVAVWVSGGVRGTPSNVIARVFSDNGKPKTPEIRVSSADAGRQVDPAVAASANGDFVVVWQSQETDDSPTRVWGQRFTAAGQRIGGRFPLGTWYGHAQSEPDVAMNAYGSYFVAVWTEVDRWVDGDGQHTTDVFARIFDEEGKPEFALHDRDLYQHNPAVSISADGWEFAVAYEWSSGRGPDATSNVYAQRFEYWGRTIDYLGYIPQDSNRPSGSRRHDPVIALAHGAAFVAWMDERADPEQANDPGGRTGIRGTTWRYDEPKEEIRIPTFSQAEQTEPAIAATPDPGFLAVWTSQGNHDGDGRGIFLRRFGADGRPLSGELQVNVHAAGNQSQPAIALAPDGRGVVVWQSMGRDGNDFGVAARRIYVQP